MASADGTWKVTMNTPMGAQAVELVLVTDGNALSGSMKSPMGGQDFSGGTCDGDKLEWAVDMTQPMPMKLEFKATVEGDSIGGNVKMGAFGDAAFNGTRA